VRLGDRHDRDRLSESVEDLHNASRLATLGMSDIIDQHSHVSRSEVVLGEIALEGDSLIEGQGHGLFSFQGFSVTNRVRPSCHDRSQIVTTARSTPFGPANLLRSVAIPPY
jgi:hypothetical protein